jgi:hypothetical protein
MCSELRISWTLLYFACFTRYWWKSHSILEFICKLWSTVMAVKLSDKFRCSYLFNHFLYSFYTYLEGTNFRLLWSGVKLMNESMPILEPNLYITAPVPSLFWAKRSLFYGLNLFRYSRLLGSWTLNGSRYANLGIIFSVSVSKIVSCSMSWDF